MVSTFLSQALCAGSMTLQPHLSGNHEKYFFHSWKHGAAQSLLVLSASRASLGPNWRWPDEEPAEKVSLGNHRFNSPKTYQGGGNLIINLAPSGFLAFTWSILFQGTATNQQTSPAAWGRAPVLSLHRGSLAAFWKQQMTPGCGYALGQPVSYEAELLGCTESSTCIFSTWLSEPCFVSRTKKKFNIAN